jgi:hypothetical protein
MPARPHDGDETGPQPPDDAADDPDLDAGDLGAGELGAGDLGAGDPGTGLHPTDVDARWLEIVGELSAPADPRSWAPDPAVEEAEDHFVPPDPPPVLGGDPLLTMAWVAVAGVPILLLVAIIAWRDIPDVVLQAAGAAFLAGVGLLLWRMPHEKSDDAGPGAVV